MQDTSLDEARIPGEDAGSVPVDETLIFGRRDAHTTNGVGTIDNAFAVVTEYSDNTGAADDAVSPDGTDPQQDDFPAATVSDVTTADEVGERIQVLINAVGAITDLDVDSVIIPALHDGWFRGMRPVRALLTTGILTDETADKLLRQNVGYMAIEPTSITPETASMLPQWFCEQHNIVPVHHDGETLTVVGLDTPRPLVKTELESMVDCPVSYRMTSAESLAACMVALPGRRNRLTAETTDDTTEGTNNTSITNWQSLTQADEDEDKEVAQHVKALITRAVAIDASDIHIQTELNNKGNATVTAHLRRLGDLVPHDVYNTTYGYKLINRLKVAGGFDVDPTKPCDGRYDITIPGSGRYDLRLAGMPLAQGQMLVVRMLPQMRKGKKTLKALFPQEFSDVAGRIRQIASQPEGMLLVVGSTGSGKSTTLTAMIQPLAKNSAIKVVTVEDPVENLIRGAQQVAVTSRLGFSDALRGFLRSDPDAILLGEIRDRDTASMAIRAAQTGHIVFSTLHASSVEMTPRRLAEMGVPLASLADVLLGVLSQRLVKTLCEYCSSALSGGKRTPKPRGCDACANTGWGGRMAIVEFMEVTPEVASLIADGAPARELRAAAQIVSYSQFAARLIDAGLTTREAIKAKLGKLYEPGFETDYGNGRDLTAETEIEDYEIEDYDDDEVEAYDDD